jgi:hypothetical protein
LNVFITHRPSDGEMLEVCTTLPTTNDTGFIRFSCGNPILPLGIWI